MNFEQIKNTDWENWDENQFLPPCPACGSASTMILEPKEKSDWAAWGHPDVQKAKDAEERVADPEGREYKHRFYCTSCGWEPANYPGLAWTPGKPGKGVLFANGQHHNWNVEHDDPMSAPHHGYYNAYTSEHDADGMYNVTYNIHPNGTVDRFGLEIDEDDMARIMASDGRLSGAHDDFHFADYDSERQNEVWDEFYGEGKEPDFNSYVEMVPTSVMWPYREFTRDLEESDYDRDLTRHLDKHGIKDPLRLQYHPETGTAYLGEGNHRLHWAFLNGVEHVPVVVNRWASTRPTSRPVPTPLIPNEHGYVPGMIKPSQIGLPTVPMKTSATDQWEPGTPGKAWLYTNGKVDTWPVDSVGFPVHSIKKDFSQIEKKPDRSVPVFINANGTYWSRYKLEPEEHARLCAHHPALRNPLEEFKFSANFPEIVVNNKGFHDYERNREMKYEDPDTYADLAGEKWENRRPFIYDPRKNVVYVGGPGSHHENIEQEYGLAMYGPEETRDNYHGHQGYIWEGQKPSWHHVENVGFYEPRNTWQDKEHVLDHIRDYFDLPYGGEKFKFTNQKEARTFYHVAPRKYRDSILQQGLLGYGVTNNSPWTELPRNYVMPSGTYMWNHPDNAELYANMLGMNANGGDFPGGKNGVEDFEIEDDDGNPMYIWDDDEDGYVENPEFKGGYDIWAIDGKGLNLQHDPENALDQGPLTPDQAQKQINEEVSEYGAPEMVEGHRFFTPDVVDPSRLQLHRHISPGEISEWNYYGLGDEIPRVPEAWTRVPFDQWSERAQRRFTSASQLGWEPGNYGKGWVLEDGSIRTWNVDEENLHPPHMQMLKKIHAEGLREMQIRDDSSPSPQMPPGGWLRAIGAFHIRPDGQIVDRLDSRFLEPILRADPRLYDPNSQFSFS